MSYPLPDLALVRPFTPSEQPVEHLVEAAGFFFKTYRFPYTDMFVPQHVHPYDHATLVCAGKIRGWRNGEWIGDKGAGEVFEVKAGEEHHFQSLQADSMLTCIHSVSDALKSQEK